MTRRTFMLGSRAGRLMTAGALAQDWKAKYPELVFAVVPAENASGTVDRWHAVRRLSDRSSSAPR